MISDHLTHLDSTGKVRMVDVGGKNATARQAIAFGTILTGEKALQLLTTGTLAKGDAWAASRVAGIMAAKRTSEFIPLTHPIRLDSVAVHLFPMAPDRVGVFSFARATDRTGVEMEAMVAVSTALLNVYDMVKAVTKAARIEEVRLIAKSGGKSGDWLADDVARGTIEMLAISKSKGTPKEPLKSAEFQVDSGMKDDAHAGNWHRQVSLLGTESIKKMQDKGLKVDFGSFAENIATSGVCLFELPVGSLLISSDGVILEVTQIGKECHTRCAVYHQAGDCVMPKEGIFARVLLGGQIAQNDLFWTLPPIGKNTRETPA